jgi:hypothetical protein
VRRRNITGTLSGNVAPDNLPKPSVPIVEIFLLLLVPGFGITHFIWTTKNPIPLVIYTLMSLLTYTLYSELPNPGHYARLDAFSFNSLLQRSGDIHLLRPICRGSSLLPEAAQEPCQSDDLSTYIKYHVDNMSIARKSLSIAS